MRTQIDARCIGSTGAALGVSSERHFHTARTHFDVKVGSVYQVSGMGIWETVLLVLIRDDSGKPTWLPIGLFDIDISSLPGDWEFRLIDGIAASGGDASNRWVAMWGYAELVRDRQHSNALIERDPDALRIFDRRVDPGLGTEG